MPSQGNPRKRPAPGSIPIIPQQMPGTAGGMQPLPDDQFLDWGLNNEGAPSFPDIQSGYGNPIYGDSTGTGAGSLNDGVISQQLPATSTQLTRRPMGQQQVVALGGAGRPQEDDDAWLDFSENMQMELRPDGELKDDEEGLEQRAQIAKRDALAKRKQIPPFVQKLSSFLDQSRNTDLIRWSDKGDSFIVLDEDEFAKTLIPELFKHNNYASFVRQLNMYGFHKKVGLSDNSMRASERKNKNPSEYFNRYFRRGKPDLLWLINKPKSTKAPTATAATDEGLQQAADDSGSRPAHRAIQHAGPNSIPAGSGQVVTDASGARRMVASEKDMSEVRQQLETIQSQQRVISGAINRLRKDQKQIYEQAVAFQTLHDRHESSINAILTFLATVYNRSLNDHGVQNFANLFSNAIPQDAQGQRDVVDVGDGEVGNQKVNQSAPRFRKPPLLLGPPPVDHQDSYGRATTVSPSASTTSPQIDRTHTTSSSSSTYPPSVQTQSPKQSRRAPPSHPISQQQPPPQPDTTQDAAIEELFESSTSSPFNQRAGLDAPVNLDNISAKQQRDIMSMINASNASHSNSPSDPTAGGPQALDFPAALTHYQTANGASPLTSKQRSDMLHLMARDTNLAAPAAGSAAGGAVNNALTSPAPAASSFLDLAQLNTHSDELDQLSKMQAQQDANVEHLRHMIQPLSPTGLIPGLSGQGNGQWLGDGVDPGAPGALDLDQIFNSGDYFGGGAGGGEGGDDLVDFDAGENTEDFNFGGIDGVGDGGGVAGLPGDEAVEDGEAETVRTMSNSEGASPAANPGGEDVIASPSSKRRKRG